MTPQGLFGVFVRTIGLLAFVYGLWALAGAIAPQEGYKATDYLVGSVPLILVGLFLMLKADGVAATCYAKQDHEEVQ